ncbi:hypothetical protein GCM10010172_20810 [Paractinoplanes ferrugineus]|uniref:Low molecular weight protein antigen 6 PH domain-containing protein n=1 Tax=Paractinoplanes ferrugineus TaxID=113564 RepID=A0A919IVQ7_9ACTN|nr:PH domain-containing protein [Actinoplanes ferrugineus]GIE09008.1 hypothetical protein Afe05nite_08480 [Actinoplanes ferrugineus]
MRRKPLLRVRKTGALLVAAVIAFVGTVPLAGAGWAWAPVLLVPVAMFVWAWRAGTDVYADELRVRALVGSTEVPWQRISELAPDSSGQVSALLDNGNLIRLTGVTKVNLPLVLAAGKQEISQAQPTDGGKPQE